MASITSGLDWMLPDCINPGYSFANVCLTHVPYMCCVLQVVRSMITPRRLDRMASGKLSMAEALQWLCRAEPTSKDLLEALQAWTAKTPARVALTQARHP